MGSLLSQAEELRSCMVSPDHGCICKLDENPNLNPALPLSLAFALIQTKHCPDIKRLGTQICNDNDHEIEMNCWNAGYFASKINALCCNPKGTPGFGGKSGQMFHPQANWNVVIGSGNCKTPPDTPPEPVGAGNNKKCMPSFPWQDRIPTKDEIKNGD